MDNYAIADNFSLLAKLIDIHGDDSFKAKSYAAAAFTIEKLPTQLAEMPHQKIFAIKGIGQAIGKKIIEQLEEERLTQLDEYLAKTPLGILELMKIKGLGPKKISLIWKELGIETMGELLYACEENRLLLYKGFGAKTQKNIEDSIRFFMASKGSYLYSQIEDFVTAFTERLQLQFPSNTFTIAGSFARQAEVIEQLEWVTDCSANILQTYFNEQGYETALNSNTLSIKGPENVAMLFTATDPAHIASTEFEKNCSPEFLFTFIEQYQWKPQKNFATEQDIFAAYNLPYLPPYLREFPQILEQAAQNKLPEVIQQNDIKGIVHTHSNWSDGVNSIEEMARGAIAKGYEYLVISDHSQSAFYANGLYPDRLKAQHEMIDELNAKLAPFKIFKSVESDILNDGNLDYPEDVLSTFDIVIASVHANLKMTEEKAMLRLLKAIANPYTSILGHMTGRLLLSRSGYPVNYETVIEACARYNVVIELNAHSRRLDMDWRQIPNAVKKNVLISIDPDAHSIDGFDDVKYGVLVAQKGMLTATQNLSSYSLANFEKFVATQKAKRP